MRTIKGKVAVAVTVAVWTVALGAAAALSYDLNRPLHSRPTPPGGAPAAQVSPPPEAEPATEPASEDPSVMHIPPATIVGRAVRHPAIVSPPKAPDQPEMVCDEWRNLDMGSGRVQVCREPPKATSLDAPGR